MQETLANSAKYRRWMQLLLDNPEALKDFNQWVDDHSVVRSWLVLNDAKTFEEVLGVRYLIGELQGMRDFINQPLTDAANIREKDNGGNVEQLEEYLTRSGYYAT